MSEIIGFGIDTKSPVIQEIIMSNRIGAISVILAQRLDIPDIQALKLFYENHTCAQLHESLQAFISTVTTTLPMNICVRWRVGNKIKICRI